MLPARHVTVFCRGVPYPSGIACHLRQRHTYSRVVVGVHFPELDFLVRHRFLHPGGVNQRVLGAVAFRDYGNDSQNFTVFMPRLLGFQTNGVVYRLVPDNFARGNIHEADRFGSGDDRGHLLVDGQLLEFLVSLLGERGQAR